MSRVSEIEAQRDATLSEMEHNYRSQQNDYEQEKEEIKSRGEEKQARGEDISAEVNEYKEKEAMQDHRFDQYEAEREKVWGDYQNDIDAAEQEEQEQDQDYGY